MKATAKWVDSEPRVKKLANWPGEKSSSGRYRNEPKKQNIAITIEAARHLILIVVLSFIYVASLSLSMLSDPQFCTFSMTV